MVLFFVIFFLFALACAGLFFYLRFKNKLPDLELKRIGYYVAGVLIIIIFISLLTAINSLRTVYFITSILFLLIGILHLWLMYRIRIIPKESKYFLDFILTGFIFFMGGMLFAGSARLITQFVLEGHDNYTSAIIPFIIPLFAYTTYKYWHKIPKLVPKAWCYNEFDNPQIPDDPDEKWLNYIFCVNDIDYSMRMPKRVRVGDAFHIAILESKIDGIKIKHSQLDEQGNVIQLPWYLITEDLLAHKRRYVNPELTFANNGIQDGDIIWVRNSP